MERSSTGGSFSQVSTAGSRFVAPEKRIIPFIATLGGVKVCSVSSTDRAAERTCFAMREILLLVEAMSRLRGIRKLGSECRRPERKQRSC
jgi:hypothetical protein